MRLRLTNPVLLALAIPALTLYGRLVLATARVRPLTPPPPELTQGPVMLALWHQHLFAVPLLAAPNRPVPLVGLMSPSADGKLTRGVAARFGIQAAIGSSNRRAVAGSRDLLAFAKAGHSLFLTVDGPRGPARRAKPGALKLAHLAGLPVVPAALVRAQPALHFRSWDRFILPLPWATFELAWGTALPATASPDQLTAALNALTPPPAPKARPRRAGQLPQNPLER